jgi:hypothetical protein
MKNGQWPTLIPFPLPLLCFDNVDCGKFSRDVSISTCPFFHRRFDLTWDYKFAFCKYVYHSQCVISHFSNPSKCLLKGCGEEMHSN